MSFYKLRGPGEKENSPTFICISTHALNGRGLDLTWVVLSENCSFKPEIDTGSSEVAVFVIY